MKDLNLVQLFPHAHKFDGLAGDCLDGQSRAAPGVAVQGSGTQVVDINRLLKQFDMLQAMTKQFSGGKLPKNLRRMMGKKGRGMPGMGGMPF